MSTFQHKAISVSIAIVATYFGFQALDLILDLYQIETYFAISWYVFIFHVFWLVFIFDLHLKRSGHLEKAREHYSGIWLFFHALKNRIRHLYHWSYLRKYANYLILPTIFYWSVIVLMFLNPFHELFKDGLIIVTTAAMAVTYWYFKEAFSHHMEMHNTGLKVLNLVKLFAAYLTFTAALAVGWYYGLSLQVLMPAVFILTSLLVYQALYQHRLMRFRVYPAIMMLAVLVTLVYTIVFQNWNNNYYTAGLIVAAVYNTSWGLLHRDLEKTLTRKIMWEYVFMLLVLVSLILATHDFQGRI